MEDGQSWSANWAAPDSGFGIPSGSVDLVEVKRIEKRHPMTLPLPPPSPDDAPILQEFLRPWKELRLPILSAPKDEAKGSLMRSYEPQYTPGEPTFASGSHLTSFLDPRVAVPEAQAFLITPRIRFLLGTVETLSCKVAVYDMALGCRATEEFGYKIPGPLFDQTNGPSPLTLLFYVLPTLQVQHLYVLLKVSKGLVGDGDSATAPYCTPDKFVSKAEQQKLIDLAEDCRVRLGRFEQPLAWGIIPLSHGTKQSMTLYRQRGCISEEQRIAMMVDASRGLVKEKVTPALCEFDIDAIAAEEVADAKFKSGKTGPLPRLQVIDPFSEQNQDTLSHAYGTAANKVIVCHEVQSFCTSSLVSTCGAPGSGPVALSYVNAVYVYPLQLEKCLFRNIAIRVQLLQSEVDVVQEEDTTDEAVVRAIYRAKNQVQRSAYTLVGYHQKNPQYDDEVKICLPACLTATDHLFFTLFHVHCKKVPLSQPQAELFGWAVLPMLGKDGTILQDGKYAVNIHAAPACSSKSSAFSALSLPTGYVAAAREVALDHTKPVFTCRTRVLSSIHSQDSAVAAFLSPFHGSRNNSNTDRTEDTIDHRLGTLTQSDALNACYFFFLLAKFVLGYLCYGTSRVQSSAFCTLLAIIEKTTWTPRGSCTGIDRSRVLDAFVHLVFDETSIEDPYGRDEKRQTKFVYWALLEAWLHVLDHAADRAETKRMSLTFSNVLLQLILKSMAMSLLNQGSQSINEGPTLLPRMLDRHDEVKVERLVTQLVACASDPSNGLLLQKEVNRSVAYFCRGIFLVVKNVFPAQVLDRYIQGIDGQGDAKSICHLWLPFLQLLVEFEFFPTINGIEQESAGTAPAWLALAISAKLLQIIETQSEPKIRVDSVRLLRRMFAVQVYHPSFQRKDQQARIALLYYPLIPRFAHLMTRGKVLSKTVPIDSGSASGLNGKGRAVWTLQKELMVCIGHLLCSVSNAQLPRFFQPRHGLMSTLDRAMNVDVTEAYDHVVDQLVNCARYSLQQPCVCALKSVPTDSAVGYASESSGDCQYDESTVHASLALIQRMLEIFLRAASSTTSTAPLWCQLLSPDLSASTTDTGLSLLETRRSNRVGGLHGRARGGLEASARFHSADRPRDATTQMTTSGVTTHTSLPRNWSKQDASTQQRLIGLTPGLEDYTTSLLTTQTQDEEYEKALAALQLAVAQTALRVLQTAVDQYNHVIRLIEAAYTPRLGHALPANNVAVRAVSPNQAFVLLSLITDLLFQLLQRSSSIRGLAGEPMHERDTQPDHQLKDDVMNASDGTKACFVGTLLQYLHVFVQRFAVALFAVRLPGLSVPYDRCRIQLLLSLASTASQFAVRRHATMLLSQLLTLCYEQSGSFLLVKAPILKVLTAAFFPSPRDVLPLTLSSTSVRALLNDLRALAMISPASASESLRRYRLPFLDLLRDLTTKVDAYERWHSAFHDPTTAHDAEEIEEGIEGVVQDISIYWLLDVKLVWHHALLQLHVRRGAFAEAVCCKLAAIAWVQRARVGRTFRRSSDHYRAHEEWITRELLVARSYAARADWIEKEVSICELLLVHLKQQRRFRDYQDMLPGLAALMGRLTDRLDPEGQPSAFSFYRVRYAGDCVSAMIAQNEFIYTRSNSVSLGDFVTEMKARLRAKYPHCERVDVVHEPKPLASKETTPNVIFLRVTTVEVALADEVAHLQAPTTQAFTWQVAFKFAVPFTRTSSLAYGKTCDQMNRITFLSVAHAFPCHVHRQRVCLRHEEIQSPIEVSMADIHKRCALLRAEIAKQSVGKTDLKTLTMVLKGSVNTHVHGGIPEVLASFLATETAHVADQDLNSSESEDKRHALANLLVDFAHLCWQCLCISREAYGGVSPPSPPHVLAPAALMSTDLLLTHYDLKPLDAATDAWLPPDLETDLRFTYASRSSSQELDSLPRSVTSVSPLQVEFDRSFASIVHQLRTQIPFTFKNTHKLARLEQQTLSLDASVVCSAPRPRST